MPDPEPTTVLEQRHGPVTVLTLDRPRQANALSVAVLEDLVTAFRLAEADPDTRVLVLTGAGRHFCAGLDLTETAPLPPGLDVGTGFAFLTKPIIAAVNGAAVGGGCELALACDFRYAASSAVLGLPEIRFGDLPGGGATARLAKVVGPSAAKRLIMTGERLPADRALGIGLVDRVVGADDLVAQALQFATELAARPLYALRAAKLLVDRSLDTDVATALAFEKQVTETMATPEQREEARAEAARQDATYARLLTPPPG